MRVERFQLGSILNASESIFLAFVRATKAPSQCAINNISDMNCSFRLSLVIYVPYSILVALYVFFLLVFHWQLCSIRSFLLARAILLWQPVSLVDENLFLYLHSGLLRSDIFVSHFIVFRNALPTRPSIHFACERVRASSLNNEVKTSLYFRRCITRVFWCLDIQGNISLKYRCSKMCAFNCGARRVLRRSVRKFRFPFSQ